MLQGFKGVKQVIDRDGVPHYQAYIGLGKLPYRKQRRLHFRSHASTQEAARIHDQAAVAIYGLNKEKLNFPNDIGPEVRFPPSKHRVWENTTSYLYDLPTIAL